MTDHPSNGDDVTFFLRNDLARLSWMTLIGVGIGLFVARAPTSYTGDIPLVGDYVPLKLNAVYVIVFGPALVALACWFIRRKAARQLRAGSRTWSSEWTGARASALAVVFVLIAISSTAFSLQYFLVLAPAELCATAPNLDLLWRDLDGPTRIVHCMSETDEINKATPFYLEPQALQAWGHVLWPALSAIFLAKGWQSLRRGTS